MALNDGQVNVINDIVNLVNIFIKSNKNIPKCVFDELSTTKDSLCLTTTSDSNAIEKMADVTGLFLTGTLRLKIMYRVMSLTTGNDDLKYIGILDSIYQYIQSCYKTTQFNNFYIEKVTQISGAKLEAVYPGGVKDFSGIFEIQYERRVK